MIFEPIRTRRLAVKLTELTLGDAIDLCKLPAERHERATTELLRRIAAEAKKPSEAHVTDPLLWTVEERAMVMCMYLAQVSPDGPDFGVGETARLSNYIDLTRDLAIDSVSLGPVAKAERVMRPLLGIHAQTLELICTTRGEWVLGAIACQMFKADEAPPDWLALSDIALREWIEARMAMLRKSPESWVAEVLLAWERGAGELAHFFSIGFDKEGVLFHAKQEGGEEAVLPPARFRPLSCVSDEARFLSE